MKLLFDAWIPHIFVLVCFLVASRTLAEQGFRRNMLLGAGYLMTLFTYPLYSIAAHSLALAPAIVLAFTLIYFWRVRRRKLRGGMFEYELAQWMSESIRR